MNTLFMVLIVFIALMGFVMYPMLRWNWSPSSSPFFGVFTIISLLYIFGLLNLLLFGFYFLFTSSIVLIILAIYQTRKEYKRALSQITSPSFIIFLLLFALLGYLSRSWRLSGWDEYSHWGIFAKAMYFEDKFPAQVDFVIVWPNYPPGITIFQYYVTKLAGYSEKAVFFAQNIVILSAIIATLGNVNWKKSYLAIGAVFFYYWSIYFWGYIVNTIYMDGLLGVVFGATIVAYESDVKRDWIAVLKIAPVLFVLPLIKQLGIIFSLIIAGVVIFDQVVLKGGWSGGIKGILNKNGYSRLLMPAVVLVIPLLSSFSWMVFLSFWKVKVIAINIQLNTLLNAFSIWATDMQRGVISVFMQTYQNSKIGFSPYGCVGIIVALVVLILVFVHFGENQHHNSGTVYFQYILFFGFLFYSIVILVVYIAINDLQLQSYARYMGTYCLGWSYTVFGMFYLELKNGMFDSSLKDQRSAILTMLYSFSIMVVFATTSLSTIFTPPVPFDYRIYVDKTIGNFIPVMEEDSRVWIIWQNTNGLEFHVTRYLVAPRMVNEFTQNFRWSLGEPYYEGDIWTYDISPEDWRAIIDRDNYSYILVGRADDQFWNTFGEMFCGESATSKSQLFKVESNCFTVVNP